MTAPRHRWKLKSVKPTRFWGNVGRRLYSVTITNKHTRPASAKGWTEHEFIVPAWDRRAAGSARRVLARMKRATAEQIIDSIRHEAKTK